MGYNPFHYKLVVEMVTVAAQTSLNKDDGDNSLNNTLRRARDVALRCKCKPSCTSIEYEAETSQADFDWRAIYTSYQLPIAPTMNE